MTADARAWRVLRGDALTVLRTLPEKRIVEDAPMLASAGDLRRNAGDGGEA